MRADAIEYPISKVVCISFAGFGAAAEMKQRVGAAADRYLWRDIEREFNFKAAMRGKAMIRKRSAQQ